MPLLGRRRRRSSSQPPLDPPDGPLLNKQEIALSDQSHFAVVEEQQDSVEVSSSSSRHYSPPQAAAMHSQQQPTAARGQDAPQPQSSREEDLFASSPAAAWRSQQELESALARSAANSSSKKQDPPSRSDNTHRPRDPPSSSLSPKRRDNSKNRFFSSGRKTPPVPSTEKSPPRNKSATTTPHQQQQDMKRIDDMMRKLMLQEQQQQQEVTEEKKVEHDEEATTDLVTQLRSPKTPPASSDAAAKSNTQDRPNKSSFWNNMSSPSRGDKKKRHKNNQSIQSPPRVPSKTSTTKQQRQAPESSSPQRDSAGTPPSSPPRRATTRRSPPRASAAATTTTTTTPSGCSTKTRAFLSRPFGTRPSSSTTLQSVTVHVSSAEWDTLQQEWKYPVTLVRQQPVLLPAKKNKSAASSTPVTTSCRRSLADFYWLQQALQKEYQGGLLIPPLQTSTDSSSKNKSKPDMSMPVAAQVLQDWLSDVVNGVRGQGEVVLLDLSSVPSPDQGATATQHLLLDSSESMEAFLYRNQHLGPARTARANSQAGSSDDEDEETSPSRMTPPHEEHSKRRRSKRLNDEGVENCSGFWLHPFWALFSSPDSSSAHPATDPLEFCAGGTATTRRRRTDSGDDSLLESSLSSMNDHRPHKKNLASSVSSSSMTPETARRSASSRRSYPSNLVDTLFTCSSRAMSPTDDDGALQEDSSALVDSAASTSASGSSGVLDAQHPSSSATVPVALHSDLLEAEKELLLSYRTTTLSAVDKLRKLTEQEEKLGLAWKRFAISMSNLFAYEKDVEHARLGNAKAKKENMPYRKLQRSTVDDCLRVVARQKSERSIPSLNALAAMLNGYVTDLNTVEPSMDEYNRAIAEIPATGSVRNGLLDGHALPRDGRWDDQLRSLAKAKLADVQKHAKQSFHSPQNQHRHFNESSPQEDRDALQRRAYITRLLANERLFRTSLTTLCCTTQGRVSRMAWRYWNTEVLQCSLLKSACTTLRTEVDVASKDSVSKMIHRHLTEDKKDSAAELDLVQRILSIGQHSRKSDSSTTTEMTDVNGDVQIEVDNDDHDDERNWAIRRDKALQMARERVGKWDAKLALAIMEAVGVEDPNVRVEETTRDLRLIRKYAAGLRENLNRCIEAIQLVRAAMTTTESERPLKKDQTKRRDSGSKQEDTQTDIRESRQLLLVDLAKLFSGTFIPATSSQRKSKRSSLSVSVLAKAGVDTSDPFGWASAYQSSSETKKLLSQDPPIGDLAIAYMKTQDSQTDWLLTSMSELLNEYFERVEVVESFVYMECVGSQLEKHFSRKRTEALAAFEKKTDVTTAINIARRKRLRALVNELEGKLEALGQDISHTMVKGTKEAHLESKNLKTELHDLAMRRLMIARETSTERVITLLTFWAREEEMAAAGEIKALGDALAALEKKVDKETIDKLTKT